MLEAESMNDALIEAVKALGGSKQVGPMLWPEAAPDAAQRKLLDALNPDRPAHLTPDQAVLVLRKARLAGHHQAAEWLMHKLGYAAPQPVEPRNELAELQRQFIGAVEVQRQLLQQMERLQGAAALVSSASTGHAGATGWVEGRPSLRAAA